ncbi:unnamed protein product [Symbiodinium sp. KB8]|nr:unnamed protein product [Symbiodinium sp. KB8]
MLAAAPDWFSSEKRFAPELAKGSMPGIPVLQIALVLRRKEREEVPKSSPSVLAAAVSAAANEHAASARLLTLEALPVATASEGSTAKPGKTVQATAPPSLAALALPAVEASAAIAAAAMEASVFAESVATAEHLQAKATRELPAISLAPPVPAPGAPAGCWQDGYTPELCCRDPPVANCWDAVFTRQRCCPKKETPEADLSSSHSLSAEVAAVVAAAAARNVASQATEAKEVRKETLKHTAGDVQTEMSNESPSEAAEQQIFLQQEAQRRWPSYFNRAHETLNAAEAPLDSKPDPVQLYHLLYETINQLVGGLSLAAEAAQSNSQMKQAFLNAAVLLARLARASRGTPLEHEDFASQSAAAMALGCTGGDPTGPQCNLAESLHQFAMSPDLDVDWLQDGLKQLNASKVAGVDHAERFRRIWLMYSQDPSKALWRPAGPDGHQGGRTNTYNPLEVGQLQQSVRGSGSIWQLFPTYIMAREIGHAFTSSRTSQTCIACEQLTSIVLQRYQQFRDEGFGRNSRQDDVNNAFFNWQLTHDAEQEEEGADVWPELYRDSRDFQELKTLVKLSSLEYLQQIYSEKALSKTDLEQLELSIWASVTPPTRKAERTAMGLAFHDHPLALLSGVFYAEAGGELVADRTPTVFADPRGTTPFRYTRMRSDEGEATLEPTAPFHRLAYAHPRNGLSLVFPSWLVHGVAPHRGPRDRVVFAYNLHTVPGTTLASWAKTTL